MAAGLFLVVAAGAAAYCVAAHRLRRPWPRRRTACFLAGCAAATVALALDGDRRFSVHVAQHLLVGMLAPALVALAAPVTLALTTVRPPVRRRLRRVLHSTPLAAVGHPVVAWALFGGSLFALYLTPLYRLSLDHAWLHDALHLHFLATGALFFWPVVGVDPGPRRLHHGARLLMVALTIPFHAVLGLALLSATEPLAAAHSLADQRAGAGLLWAAGDLLGLAAVLVVAAQWMAYEERQAGREDRGAATPT